MAKRGHPRTTISKLPQEELVAMLSAAVANHDDFVLAWEPRPGEEPASGTEPVVHVMTGNLVTPCRLNGLKGRAILYEDEGARIVTFKENDDTTGPKK
jgi:hypothetical protein